MGYKKKKLKLIKLQSWYKTKRLNYARTITLSFWKSNTHQILTHIPRYMCSPTWETHIPSGLIILLMNSYNEAKTLKSRVFASM